MEGKAKRREGLAGCAGEKGSGERTGEKGKRERNPRKIKSSVVIIKGFLKIARTGFKMLFPSLNLIILRGWEQLSAQPSQAGTERAHVSKSSLILFSRFHVWITQNTAQEEPRGLRSCALCHLFPFPWRGREPACASLSRPLLFLWFSCTFKSNLSLTPAATPEHTHNLQWNNL